MAQSKVQRRTEWQDVPYRPAPPVDAPVQTRSAPVVRTAVVQPLAEGETRSHEGRLAVLVVAAIVLGVPAILAATGHWLAGVLVLGGFVLVGVALVKWGFWILDNVDWA